jgi:hypothetical protein
MTDLCALPDELLLAITNCLRRGTNNGYGDLKHFALSCRKLRPIAQEALHTEVSVKRPRLVRGPTGIARLARTLLQRPDLAARVRKLHIMTSDWSMSHSEDCAHRMHCFNAMCICGLEQVLEHCTSFLCSAKTRNGLPLRNKAWVSMLYQRKEVAISALILCVTSALETLTLTSSMVPREDFQESDNEQYVAFEALFGCESSHKSSVDHIGGLSNLTHFSTDGFPPCSWLRLPRLKAFKLNILDDYADKVQDGIVRSYKTPSVAISTTLTRLVIQTEFEVFYSDEVNGMHGIYGPMSNKVNGLSALTHLLILFRLYIDIYNDPTPYDSPQGSYARITSELKSRTLTHLTLEVEEVPGLPDQPLLHDSILEYIHDLQPMSSFPGLPNLRHLTAPQEAFFSADEDFETCVLPATIQSIGIIDSTYETKRYIKHVLEGQSQWVDLKLINLGKGSYDHLYRYPDGSEDGDISEDESEDGEWRELFHVNDSIYEEARSAGLRVRRIRDGTAWRKDWDGLSL